jgi:hypothetical protein
MCHNNTYAYCKQVKLLSSLQEIVDIDSIPTQLGGTSEAVIGVHDPMWKEIDHVMAELAAADHKRLVSPNYLYSLSVAFSADVAVCCMQMRLHMVCGCRV